MRRGGWREGEASSRREAAEQQRHLAGVRADDDARLVTVLDRWLAGWDPRSLTATAGAKCGDY